MSKKKIVKKKEEQLIEHWSPEAQSWFMILFITMGVSFSLLIDPLFLPLGIMFGWMVAMVAMSPEKGEMRYYPTNIVYGIIIGMLIPISIKYIITEWPVITNAATWWFLGGIIFVVGELIYWFMDDTKPSKKVIRSKEAQWFFVIWRKIISFSKVTIAVVCAQGIIFFGVDTYNFFQEGGQELINNITHVVGVVLVTVGSLVLACTVIGILLWLNKQKYAKVFDKKGRKRK